jgi:hypothetical protein
LRYIGIDPGASGGLVLLNCMGLPLEWAAMPAAEREKFQAGAKKGKKKKAGDDARAVAEAALWQLLRRWAEDANVGDGKPGQPAIKAAIERVRASQQMSKASIWTFAQGVGTLRAFLIAAGIPFEEVAPQKWQKFIGVRDKTGARDLKDVDITEKKNRHKEKAAQLFPMLAVTHKIADALLIAEYARRMGEGFGAELPS